MDILGIRHYYTVIIFSFFQIIIITTQIYITHTSNLTVSVHIITCSMPVKKKKKIRKRKSTGFLYTDVNEYIIAWAGSLRECTLFSRGMWISKKSSRFMPL